MRNTSRHQEPAHPRSTGAIQRADQDFFKTVHSALKTGDFSPEVPACLSSLLVSLADERIFDDSKQGLKERCVAAEAADHYGLWQQARELTEPGRHLLKQIRETGQFGRPATTPQGPDAGRLLEMARLCSDYARSHFYRLQDYEGAADIAEDCLRLAKRLRNKDWKCHRTIGQINLYLGRIHRENGAYERANASFVEALDHFNERLSEQLRLRPAEDRLTVELRAARYRSAQCLAGLGWVAYTRGSLREALSYVVPAHTLFISTNDSLSTAYLQLLRASIQRSLAGSDRPQLLNARQLAADAHTSFSSGCFGDKGHDLRRSRSAYELAHIHWMLGDVVDARKSLLEAADLTTRLSDDRWRCYVSILESRIECRHGDPHRAEMLANDALDLARQKRFAGPRSGAHISRGEARLKLGRTADARQDFESALRMNSTSRDVHAEPSNPQIEAACVLNLARCCIAEGHKPRAMEYLTQWFKIASRVEHRLVHDMAADVQREVVGYRRDFVIPEGEPDLNYARRKLALRRFLYDQALAASDGRKADIADRLGITRQGLNNWERDFRKG